MKRKKTVILSLAAFAFVALIAIFQGCYDSYFNKDVDFPGKRENSATYHEPCKGDSAIKRLRELAGWEDLLQDSDRETTSYPDSQSAECSLLEGSLNQGRMMKVCLRQDYKNPRTGVFLPRGTILYGQIRIKGERIHCNFKIAQSEGQKSIVNLFAFDRDNTPGIDPKVLSEGKRLLVR